MAKSPSATATPAAFGGLGAPAEQASRPARGGERWGAGGGKALGLPSIPWSSLL